MDAKLKSNRRAGMHGGFTLVELLVVIAIITLLISILLPAIQKARQASYAIACGSNMRQIGIAAAQYMSIYGCYLPAGYVFYDSTKTPTTTVMTWDDLIAPYIGKKQPNRLLICPADGNPRHDGSNNLIPDNYRRSYAANRNGLIKAFPDGSFSWQTQTACDFGNDADPNDGNTTYERQPIKYMLHIKHVHNPSTLIHIAECSCFWNYQVKSQYYIYCWMKGTGFEVMNNGNPLSGPPYTHYGKVPGDGKMNYLFCDGHVELLIPATTTTPVNFWKRQ